MPPSEMLAGMLSGTSWVNVTAPVMVTAALPAVKVRALTFGGSLVWPAAGEAKAAIAAMSATARVTRKSRRMGGALVGVRSQTATGEMLPPRCRRARARPAQPRSSATSKLAL
jgi:hypothetical protein